jgi:hypothetical protein
MEPRVLNIERSEHDEKQSDLKLSEKWVKESNKTWDLNNECKEWTDG